jgi:hypothetical protein
VTQGRYDAQGACRWKVFVQILAILFIGMTASFSAAAQDDLDALLRRLADVEVEQAKSQETIKSLRSEIEVLRAKTKDEQQSVEVPALENEIPANDEIQASLPVTPKVTGTTVFPELANESQFVLTSEDGDFSLGIDGTLIFRYEVNHREDDGTGSPDTDQGFQMTGTRINFKGKLYEDYGYWVRFNADDFGDPVIDAALGLYHFNDDTTLVVGQFPSTLTREQGIPADRLQVAESSPTNYTFDPFGYKGVMLEYNTPRMVYRGIVNDGYRSANNAFFDQPSAKWALAGQVSGMAVGGEDDWGRFNNFTSRPGSDLAWLLNAAFHVQEGDTHGGIDETKSDDLFLGVVESSIEGDGWNLYGSGYYRYTDLSSEGISVEDIGFVLLGGTWVAKHFEVYSRYDITIPDNDRTIENDKFRTLTAGFNFYPKPHSDNIRVNAEILYMFDAEATSIVEPNVFSSVRSSPAGDQVVFRTSAVLRW